MVRGTKYEIIQFLEKNEPILFKIFTIKNICIRNSWKIIFVQRVLLYFTTMNIKHKKTNVVNYVMLLSVFFLIISELARNNIVARCEDFY